jgi:2-amino-4-hydroxy-6-hydroxymethyldihydropteridine diphosphokinase
MRVGIALGSNLGDRLGHLRLAREKIRQLPKSTGPFLFSALYETDPIGCEPSAQKFLNAVVEFDYFGEPRELLRALHAIEQSRGRDPVHAHNVSRTIDLDILYFGEQTSHEADLQLPHPRLQTRRFVLEPLADIQPELILPGQTKSIRTLLTELADDSAVVRMADEW